MSLRTFALAAAALILAACGKPSGGPTAGEMETLTVAATPVPHAEILEFVRPILAEQGVKLEIKIFNDYVQPNLQVDQKQIDCSYFQTAPYLDEFNKARGTDLVRVAGVHIEPLGAYSRRVKSIAELPDGATVAIPNEPSNGGRALLLLQKGGLITLKDPKNPLSSLNDIASNPKKLKFRELEAPALPRVLSELDLAVINTNYALDAKLDPAKDALILEDKDSPYVNMLVARPDNKDDSRIRKLAAALTSPAVKAYIEKTYRGAVQPAF